MDYINSDPAAPPAATTATSASAATATAHRAPALPTIGTRGSGLAPGCRTSGQRRRGHPPRVDALICDIDNVILTHQPAVAYGIEDRHGLGRGTLLDVLNEWPTAKLASVGGLDHSTWLGYLRQTLPPAAAGQWLAYHGTPNRPVIELLAAARGAGLRLLLHGNGTRLTQADLAHHRLTELAERVYLSVDVGYAKPDPRAYTHVLYHAALRPARVLYIDDNPAWLRECRQLGMRSLLYRDPDQLRQQLAHAGVAA